VIEQEAGAEPHSRSIALGRSIWRGMDRLVKITGRTAMRLSLIAAAIFVLAGTAAADESKVRALAPGAKPGAATIAQAAWLAGRWVGEGFGSQLEEVFSPPTKDSMAGHFQIVKDGQTQMFEFLEMKEQNGTLDYRVKHFNPDMTGWEEKDKFKEFKLVEADGDTLYFDGLTLERTGPDSAIHWILIGMKDGKTKLEKLVYKRVAKY
jgi:hypothetical protein